MLEATNIHKVYNNGKKDLQVLKGIDIKIEKGSFVAIVGPSGAGKSTLMHILGGLDSPSQGKVEFEGENIYRLGDAEISRIRNSKIGFVFQFYHLMSEFTVLENVLMPAVVAHDAWVRSAAEPPRRGRTAHSVEKAKQLLDEVGLTERSAHFPNQLSGGEKQRVAMARALINSPALLLCDEPTGNLDSKTGDDIMALIRRISLKNRMAVVLVTHNKELAKEADHTYHLKDGKLER